MVDIFLILRGRRFFDSRSLQGNPDLGLNEKTGVD